jgi:hypothetical protein
VTLSDCEAPVLQLLRDCAHLNSGDGDGSAPTTSTSTSQQQQQQRPRDDPIDGDDQPAEDADLSVYVGGPGEGSNDGNAAGSSSWAAGNMAVVYLDWRESVELLEGQLQQGQQAPQQQQQQQQQQGGGGGSSRRSSSCERAMQGGLANSAGAPTVPASKRFRSIIASEVMYEPAHAVLVAAVLAHRLAPGGRALVGGRAEGRAWRRGPPRRRRLPSGRGVAGRCAGRWACWGAGRSVWDGSGGGPCGCCAGAAPPRSSCWLPTTRRRPAAQVCGAVRCLATFAKLRSECARRGLRCRSRRFSPAADYGVACEAGVCAREEAYEGGHLLLAVDHASAPAQDWHRDDFDG